MASLASVNDGLQPLLRNQLDAMGASIKCLMGRDGNPELQKSFCGGNAGQYANRLCTELEPQASASLGQRVHDSVDAGMTHELDAKCATTWDAFSDKLFGPSQRMEMPSSMEAGDEFLEKLLMDVENGRVSLTDALGALEGDLPMVPAPTTVPPKGGSSALQVLRDEVLGAGSRMPTDAEPAVNAKRISKQDAGVLEAGLGMPTDAESAVNSKRVSKQDAEVTALTAVPSKGGSLQVLRDEVLEAGFRMPTDAEPAVKAKRISKQDAEDLHCAESGFPSISCSMGHGYGDVSKAHVPHEIAVDPFLSLNSSRSLGAWLRRPQEVEPTFNMPDAMHLSHRSCSSTAAGCVDNAHREVDVTSLLPGSTHRQHYQADGCQASWYAESEAVDSSCSANPRTLEGFCNMAQYDFRDPPSLLDNSFVNAVDCDNYCGDAVHHSLDREVDEVDNLDFSFQQPTLVAHRSQSSSQLACCQEGDDIYKPVVNFSCCPDFVTAAPQSTTAIEQKKANDVHCDRDLCKANADKVSLLKHCLTTLATEAFNWSSDLCTSRRRSLAHLLLGALRPCMAVDPDSFGVLCETLDCIDRSEEILNEAECDHVGECESMVDGLRRDAGLTSSENIGCRNKAEASSKLPSTSNLSTPDYNATLKPEDEAKVVNTGAMYTNIPSIPSNAQIQADMPVLPSHHNTSVKLAPDLEPPAPPPPLPNIMRQLQSMTTLQTHSMARANLEPDAEPAADVWFQPPRLVVPTASAVPGTVPSQSEPCRPAQTRASGRFFFNDPSLEALFSKTAAKGLTTIETDEESPDNDAGKHVCSDPPLRPGMLVGPLIHTKSELQVKSQGTQRPFAHNINAGKLWYDERAAYK